MPNYRGHIVGGCVTFALLFFLVSSAYTSYTTAAEWLLCTLAGSLFPDIDTKSRGQRYFYWIVLSMLLYLIVQSRLDLLALVSVCAVTPLLVRHRGIFHQARFILFLTIGLWVTIRIGAPHLARSLLSDLVFFTAGALSHIWLDCHLVPAVRSCNFLRKKRWATTKR